MEQYISLISDVLKKEHAYGYSNSVYLKQAQYFAPEYLDFIYKILKSGSLKIKYGYLKGSAYSDYEDEMSIKLDKRQLTRLEVDLHDVEVLPHELGHAVDFWFSSLKSLTGMVILNDKGQSLFDIFKEELHEKHKELYLLVMEEYKNIINHNINDNAYDILINNIDTYRELMSIPVNLNDKETTKRRRKLQNILYESGFVEMYYELFKKKSPNILNTKYAPILDALASKYNLDDLLLIVHDNGYYKVNSRRPVQEFFANLFAAKVTNDKRYEISLRKHLPKSFEGFEKLFLIFYSHIQNNKRFNDVPIKER